MKEGTKEKHLFNTNTHSQKSHRKKLKKSMFICPQFSQELLDTDDERKEKHKL